MKIEFAELADAYEEEGADGAVLDPLFEALAAVDDVIDGVTEALERSRYRLQWMLYCKTGKERECDAGL